MSRPAAGATQPDRVRQQNLIHRIEQMRPSVRLYMFWRFVLGESDPFVLAIVTRRLPNDTWLNAAEMTYIADHWHDDEMEVMRHV